ncbi:hypothetical protein ACKQF3_04350 [Vibrio cholerae]|uniref:hypothetical protein n=1 Tax=Vibrio TaxID=662 RepID=UPI00019F71AE|nr:MULTISPECIES: hypothetical protein [Vibrio]EEO05919.1 hypothetical protein VIF_002532 [Vibrio cholerae TM 11079-80]EGQ8491659.1 hypothetical protein [Vibrio cholerae]EGR0602083.1 hypothetical protein [Vibrio cholerae]EGR4273882.1 hypothetical protein [Vibrio cholerae]EIV0334524.1 hypothetical protein [Vibrio cholerae]
MQLNELKKLPLEAALTNPQYREEVQQYAYQCWAPVGCRLLQALNKETTAKRLQPESGLK